MQSDAPKTVVLDDGRVFTVDPGDTLLSAALRAGIGFPHECCSGGCGACRFELVRGKVRDVWPDAPGLSQRDRARGRKLACQASPLESCDIRVRTSKEYEPKIVPRWQRVVLERTTDFTADLREFCFRGAGQADFLPGQFALVSIKGRAVTRAYSMSNLPNAQGHWEFVIRRVPGGQASGFLFDSLRPGDGVEIDGPYGGAWYRTDSPRDIVCIAGGSGLAPALSIARAASNAEMGPFIHFYYGARTEQDVCGEAQLAELPGYPRRLRFRVAVSNPGSAWKGEAGFIHELVELDLGARLGELDFYVAGPPPMVNAVQEMLVVRHLVPHDRIHFDRFF